MTFSEREFVHIDIRKLGRLFYKARYRVTGERSERARDIGWDYVFVAVDDDSRKAITEVDPDETRHRAEAHRPRRRFTLGLADSYEKLLANVCGQGTRKQIGEFGISVCRSTLRLLLYRRVANSERPSLTAPSKAPAEGALHAKAACSAPRSLP